MQNAINWFEIPSTNFDRAVAFYAAVLKANIRKEDFMGVQNGIFVTDTREAVAGAVIYAPHAKPSQDGALIYLNAGNDLDGALSRVEPAGGKVVMPKTDIGDPGHIAIIIDTEGNKIGLHQPRG